MPFNKVILLGNLTRDPELKSTASGQSVANFSLAVNRTYNDRDGNKQEETTFVECESWGKTAETISKYLSRGRQFLVEGRLRQDTWEDKDTGKNRSQLRVVVESFSFVNDGSRGSDGASSSSSRPAPASNKKQKTEDVVVDDIDEPIDLSEIPF